MCAKEHSEISLRRAFVVRVWELAHCVITSFKPATAYLPSALAHLFWSTHFKGRDSSHLPVGPSMLFESFTAVQEYI